jgi:DNA-binding MarR family transcriptional regulator
MMSRAAKQQPAPQPEAPLAVAATLAILRTAAWLIEEVEPVFTAHRTTSGRFDMLDALKSFGRPARPVELKERLHVPAQTVTGLLDALEKGGFVRRALNPSDRRSLLVELTESGAALIDGLCPPLAEIESACLSGLSPAELERLTAMLGAIQSTIIERRAERTAGRGAKAAQAAEISVPRPSGRP